MTANLSGRRILLIVGGGIAAYKSCELVRLIRKADGDVKCVLTDGGAHFVTAMTLAALSENPVHTTLWDLKNEVEMGHIQLSRQADLVVVCPATADLMAKMAAGIADDLATTLLLATDKPVLGVPAMNVRMWQHAATVRNVATLRASGVTVMEPDEGAMACGEFGPGRLPEPDAILAEIAARLGAPTGDVPNLTGSLIARSVDRADPVPIDPEMEGMMAQLGIEDFPAEAAHDFPPPSPEALLAGPVVAQKGLARAAPPTDPAAINHEVSPHSDAAPPEPIGGPLSGKHVLITAGPTHEAIDPVRFIANRSSGKQGFAIAAAAAAAGARVTLVAGPVFLETPPGVDRVDVESARDMADAVRKALPADVAIMVAAVADWRTASFAGEKIKKRGSAPPALLLTENPDILATVSGSPLRPGLLIGFAAETENVIANATEKRARKGADWIIANDVSGPVGGSVMGGSANTVHIVTAKGVESLPEMPKEDVARALVERIADAL
ncbi:MAG: phosphopantothenoylcysteine decarboxylase / phosphopantothenate--cysteine ligase [Novosphingobium sp.]|nr:phosphopantothenoylcysteine decarboxylase / phosphopantothenate--cysteine ligase [Novosphingobium sp.]